jgi:DNA-binding NtrC family response regulator
MKKKIFVVDDEKVITDSLTAILNLKGYDATGFYDGESVLSACEQSAPECIISDVMMPGMNGVELAMKVRERMPSCRMLLFSGQAATVDLLEAARTAGHVFEVLAKPVHPSDLLARLELPDRVMSMSEGNSGSQNSAELKSA